MKLLFYSLLCFMFFTSCKTYNEDQIETFDEEISAYIETNKLNFEKSNSGLYYSIVNKGDGNQILYNDIVSFTYKANLLDGTVVDERKEPVTFKVSQLIAAWKEVLLMMKNNGKAHLIAPPQLAYGSHALGDIPANSTLEFELTVTNIE